MALVDSSKRAAAGRPFLKILVQPAPKALRFRYECEGRSAGSLPGANSTPENKTHPTIQIMNCKGPAVVVVSCVTKDQPFRPHPHKLVGKDGCKRGICTVQVNSDNMIYTFSNVGIQCVKKKDVEDALKEREEFRVDPFRTGFEHRNQASNIDLNAVRLCFQAFIEGPEKGKYTVPLQPVVSEAIYDKKAMSELVICKLSACSGSVKGGTEIILLCEKVTKDDIDVRFYEEENGLVVWEGFGDFQPNDVHKQVAITFKTPPYQNQNIEHPVEVHLQLRRRSDNTLSEPRIFQYTPIDLDPQGLDKKRRKVASLNLQRYLEDNSKLEQEGKHYPQGVQNVAAEFVAHQRPIKFAQRRYKQEPMEQVPSPYAYRTVSPAPSPVQQYYLSGIPSSSQSPHLVHQVSPSLLPTAISPVNLDMADPGPSAASAGKNLTLLTSASSSSHSPSVLHQLQANCEPPLYTDSAIKGKMPASQVSEVDTQNTSLELNFILDANDLNNMLPLSDASMNALVSTMSSSSFHMSSLEAAINMNNNDAPDSFSEVTNELLQLNQLGQNSNRQQQQ